MLQIYFASSVTSGSHHCPAAGALGLCQPSTGGHIKWAGELGVWDANEGKAGKVVKDSAAERQRAQPGAGTPRPCRMDGVSGAAVGVWGGQWGLTEQEPVPFSLGPVESLWGARKVLIRLKVTHSKQNTWPRDPSQPCHLWHCFKAALGKSGLSGEGASVGVGVSLVEQQIGVQGAVLFPSCSVQRGDGIKSLCPSTTEKDGKDPLFSNSLRLCRPVHHLRRGGDSVFF